MMSYRNSILNLSSKLFQPINIIPKNASRSSEKVQLSKSHRLMIDQGIIRPSSNGVHSILPLGIRSLEKFKNIIRQEMSKLHAQEVKLPYLTDSDLWKKSGRWNNEGFGIFTLKDRRNRDVILSPTNEELAADLISCVPQVSHQNLPLLIYQISTKFRDEIKPRCGLLKSKEFEMKDLYSFDSSVENATATYQTVSETYKRIFDIIGVPVIRVNADPGDMKGIFSHEFHVTSDLGEDIIISCNDCSHSFNSEQRVTNECENCKSNDITKITGIEVGHTFLLGTEYSRPLKAIFKTSSGTSEPLIMASYGLGLTRVLSAGIECLSSDNCIIWPNFLAPFSVNIITPKKGSREYDVGKRLSEDLYFKINEIPSLFNDTLIDDREDMTIGRRLLYAKQTGYPIVIVSGSKVTESPAIFEVHDTRNNSQQNVTFEEVIAILLQNHSSNRSLEKIFS